MKKDRKMNKAEKKKAFDAERVAYWETVSKLYKECHKLLTMYPDTEMDALWTDVDALLQFGDAEPLSNEPILIKLMSQWGRLNRQDQCKLAAHIDQLTNLGGNCNGACGD